MIHTSKHKHANQILNFYFARIFIDWVKMTQVKKRVSKKTKGSWRKIEHQDVDNFLEDQRLEERMG